MVSCLGSLVQFSPAAWRAGSCRQTSLCVGSTPRVPATLGLPRSRVSVLSPSTLLRLPAALYGAGPALYAVPVFRYSTKAQTRLRLHSVPSRPGQLRQPGACRAHSPWVRCAFSPPRFQPQFPPAPVGCVCLMFSRDHPSGCQPSRTSGSLWLETGGLFAAWEGMPSLGPNLPLSPSPCLLPPAGMGQSTAG